MLKKLILGNDARHAAGDGLGMALAQSMINKPSTSSKPRQRWKASEEPRRVSKSEATSQKSLQVSQDPPRGTEAMNPPRSCPSLSSPSDELLSRFEHRSEVPDEKEEIGLNEKQDTSWQDLELPDELGLVGNGMPREVRNIITDTLEMHRAMRISRMQSKADDEMVTNTFDGPSIQRSPVITESSAMASARSSESSTGSKCARRNNSGVSLPQESVTTVESDNGGSGSSQTVGPTTGHLGLSKQLSKSKHGHAGIDRPNSTVTGMEANFRESKDRGSKSKGLYNILKGRRVKSVATVKLSNPEPAPCECTSCFDEIPHKDAVNGLICKHRYCPLCFSQLVNTAILNEETFPPKCCLKQIPKSVMRKYLPTKELATFDEKSLEYALPLINRYYCVAPDCAKWIDTRIAKRTNGALKCPHCKTKLCCVCRGRQHPGKQDCPQDFALDATLEQAEQAGWRRCYSCRTMVELNAGCRHITCKCGAEFCYTCGAVWRTCRCTEADQRRREEQLAAARVRREVKARAEEEELRRAIAAVELAERLLREEREAEEAREQEGLQKEAEELELRELERIKRIERRFVELRALLDSVGLQQKQAMSKRHFAQDEANEALTQNFERLVAEREKQINAEKDARVAETEKAIKALQKKHAAAMMLTIQRHRREQDDVLVRPVSEYDYCQDPETAEAARLESLMSSQELERSTLKSQQAQAIENWKTGERATSAMNIKVKIQQMRFEEEERMARAIDGTNKQQDADLQWFDLVHRDRVNVLAEDERRLIASGGDIIGSGGEYGCILTSCDCPHAEGPSDAAPSEKEAPEQNLLSGPSG